MNSGGSHIQKISKCFNKLPKLFGVILLLTLNLAIFSHFCFALSSDNYTITEDLFSSGGTSSTSANFIMQTDYIGDELVIISLPEVPPTMGGEPPPTPPTPPPPKDVTPPIISDIAVSDITKSSARITWTTDENSSTEVDYGITLGYELGTETGLDGVVEHEIILLGLSPNTFYHFVVRSADASNNTNTSLDHTFTTLADVAAPIISDITITDITGTSAVINWTTNELSTSVVNYGESMAYETGSKSSEILKISHSVMLTGLNPATLYHFRVRSADAANNEAVSGDQIFTTLDTIPPLISDITIKNITSNSATIGWSTNELSTGLVGYGTTPAYEAGMGISGVFSITHELDLIGLVGNTTYHFRVTAADPVGNESTSADFTFTTSRDAVSPSNVLNFRADPDETFIILSWDNPPDADFDGVHIMRGESGFPASPEEGDVVVFHGLATSAVDRGLTPGTTYYYTAFSYDTSENFSSGAITSATTFGVAPPILPPEEIPPEEIPPEEIPPEEIPLMVPLELENISFLVASEAISLPVIEKQVKTIIETELVVAVSDEKLSKTPESLILKIGDSSYLLARNEEKERYETKITAPTSLGRYKSAFVVIYDDETSDFIDFILFADKPGLIFERQKGEEKPTKNATVTLYAQKKTGGWEIWDAAPFNQINPVATKTNGTYYFFAPRGLYRLSIQKEGYRKAESPPIDLRDVVINPKIELLKPPPKLADVIKPEAPFIENIQAVTENLTEKAVYGAKIAKEEVTQVIDDPRVEKANTVIAAPAVATVIVANASAAISLLNLLNYLRFLLTQPFLLLERKKRKGWGSVYHAFTKLPIDLAIVRLKDAKTKRIIQTRVTDKQGRFAFIVSKGKYLVEVTKPGFDFPTKALKKLKKDAGMIDVYHGEIINVGAEGETIMVNIPLDPIEVKEKIVPKKIVFKKFLKSLNRVIAFSGVGLSLVSFIISPTILLGGFVVGQIILYFLFRRLAAPKRPKAWGAVYDRKTRHPLSYVIARLFETQYNKLLETQITDARGRYVFLAGRNVYYATFEKKDYELRKTDYIDLRKAAKENVVALDIGLNKKTKT